MEWLIPLPGQFGGPVREVLLSGLDNAEFAWKGRRMRRRSGSDSLFRTALGIAILTNLGATALAQNAVDVKPSPQQTQWQDLEFGVILHFGTNTFLDREWGDGTADPKVFNPAQFDPNQWMKAIK